MSHTGNSELNQSFFKLEQPMPNGMKLDAPKQPVCQSMGPEGNIRYWSSLCNFHLRHRYGAHIRSTQN